MIMEAVYLSISAGILGGLLRAVVGWLNRPEGEPFRPKSFARSVIIASLAGAFLAYQQKSDPITTFFAAAGADLIIKEGYEALKG
jgi:fluoride ion exporter CrcB/FEX